VPGQELEQRRALRLGEPAGVADQVGVGQARVGRRAGDAGEIVNLGQRVLHVHDGQDVRQGGGFGRAERAHRLVAVQEHRGRGQVDVSLGGAGQVEPGHHGAFERDGEIVHGEGPVGQPEVEDPGHLGLRCGRGPGQVRRVPVTVSPLPRQLRQQRGGAADQRCHELLEVTRPATLGQVGGQAGAPGGEPVHLSQRISGGNDLAGVHQHRGRPGRPREIRGGQVQPRERRAGRVGVPQVSVRRPAGRVAVQVHAAGQLVGLVAPRPAPQHGLAVGQPQHGGHGLSQVAQVADQGMLGGELRRVPDGGVVALHEDGQVAYLDERGRGHRPRAAPGHDRRVRGSVAPEDGGDLVVGERGPVRCGELMAHAVDGVRAVARGGAVGHRDCGVETPGLQTGEETPLHLP
jgi:hypothetical protein